MNLGIGDFRYSDLYDFGRLNELAAAFDRFVHENDAQLFVRFESYRLAMQDGIAHGGLKEPEESELLIAVSRHLGTFLAQLFRTDPTPIKMRTERDSQVARFKKEFVAKRVAKVQNPMSTEEPAINTDDHDPEYALAVAANRLLDLERAGEARDDLEKLIQWTAAKWKDGAFEGWPSFRLPKPLVFDHLVPDEPHYRRRDGFKLTDRRMTPRQITD